MEIRRIGNESSRIKKFLRFQTQAHVSRGIRLRILFTALWFPFVRQIDYASRDTSSNDLEKTRHTFTLRAPIASQWYCPQTCRLVLRLSFCLFPSSTFVVLFRFTPSRFTVPPCHHQVTTAFFFVSSSIFFCSLFFFEVVKRIRVTMVPVADVSWIIRSSFRLGLLNDLSLYTVPTMRTQYVFY